MRRPAELLDKPHTRKSREGIRWACSAHYAELKGAGELETKRVCKVVGHECSHNFNVMARMLLKGDLMFRPVCNLNELGVAKIARSTTSAR
jgi:hypothetical protein